MSRITVGRTLWVELALVLGYLGVAVGLVLFQHESPIRFVVLLPLLLFFPGYALTTVLLPRQYERQTSNRFSSFERLALSVALSVVLFPVLGLSFYALTGTVDGPVVRTLAAMTALAMIAGTIRRAWVPPINRYQPDFERLIDSVATGFGEQKRIDTALNLILAAGVVIVVVGLLLALAAPQDGASHTEFVVGTEDAAGEFQIADYPTDLTPGEPTEFSVFVENNEGEPVTYTVVVQEEEFENDAVVQRTELESIDVSVSPNERTVQSIPVEPTSEGDVRLTFLLYDEPPVTVGRDSAYRSGYVWVTVE